MKNRLFHCLILYRTLDTRVSFTHLVKVAITQEMQYYFWMILILYLLTLSYASNAMVLKSVRRMFDLVISA